MKFWPNQPGPSMAAAADYSSDISTPAGCRRSDSIFVTSFFRNRNDPFEDVHGRPIVIGLGPTFGFITQLSSPKEILILQNFLSTEDEKELERIYSASYYLGMLTLLTGQHSYEKVGLPASLIGKISQTREMGKVREQAPAPPRSARAGGGEDNSSMVPTQLAAHSLNAYDDGSALDAMSKYSDSDPIKQSSDPTKHKKNIFLEIGGVTSKELKKPHTMLSKMKPFIKVSLGMVRIRTHTARGCNPAWDDNIVLRLPKSNAEQKCVRLRFSIYSKGWLGNVNVGSASVPLEDLLKDTSGSGKKILKVVKLSGKSQGELTFRYTFSDVASAPAAAAISNRDNTHRPTNSLKGDIADFFKNVGAVAAGIGLRDRLVGCYSS